MDQSITPAPATDSASDTDIPPREAGQLADAVRTLEATLTATRPLPEAWARDARKAGQDATQSVHHQYEATMIAYQRQRESDAPAYWLVTHPCPPWCRITDTHQSSDDPGDRVHDSEVHAVTFDSMEPSTAYAEFRAPEMTAQLTQGYREVEARVSVEFEGDPIAAATLDEAEQLAFALLALVRQGRGQGLLKALPFDEHGNCVTRDCTVCRVHEASA